MDRKDRLRENIKFMLEKARLQAKLGGLLAGVDAEREAVDEYPDSIQQIKAYIDANPDTKQKLIQLSKLARETEDTVDLGAAIADVIDKLPVSDDKNPTQIAALAAIIAENPQKHLGIE